ncbi:Hypothetical protein R9X50_00589000 [Acrodontium crateriforme]|uniref:Clr5 domain-containing protein n=1 Tax=Acrodontium crateriforme TaxID=150365 RepID=A0AAQ3RBA3_9PEZI|nr:Hypothetical protein R9X50_00589000 [Acrodontium crateriforme]
MVRSDPWAPHRPEIERMYISGVCLKLIRQERRTLGNFDRSIRAYRRKLRLWGVLRRQTRVHQSHQISSEGTLATGPPNFDLQDETALSQDVPTCLTPQAPDELMEQAPRGQANQMAETYIAGTYKFIEGSTAEDRGNEGESSLLTPRLVASREGVYFHQSNDTLSPQTTNAESSSSRIESSTNHSQTTYSVDALKDVGTMFESGQRMIDDLRRFQFDSGSFYDDLALQPASEMDDSARTQNPLSSLSDSASLLEQAIEDNSLERVRPLLQKWSLPEKGFWGAGREPLELALTVAKDPEICKLLLGYSEKHEVGRHGSQLIQTLLTSMRETQDSDMILSGQQKMLILIDKGASLDLTNSDDQKLVALFLQSHVRVEETSKEFIKCLTWFLKDGMNPEILFPTHDHHMQNFAIYAFFICPDLQLADTIIKKSQLKYATNLAKLLCSSRKLQQDRSTDIRCKWLKDLANRPRVPLDENDLICEMLAAIDEDNIHSILKAVSEILPPDRRRKPPVNIIQALVNIEETLRWRLSECIFQTQAFDLSNILSDDGLMALLELQSIDVSEVFLNTHVFHSRHGTGQETGHFSPTQLGEFVRCIAHAATIRMMNDDGREHSNDDIIKCLSLRKRLALPDSVRMSTTRILPHIGSAQSAEEQAYQWDMNQATLVLWRD